MNSATWWVDHDRQRYVVKHTPGWNRDDLVGGLSVAAMVQCGGSGHRRLDRSEVERGLDALRRFRWAVHASYFSHRIATNDMTGIDDHAENLIGLADARPHLTA